MAEKSEFSDRIINLPGDLSSNDVAENEVEALIDQRISKGMVNLIADARDINYLNSGGLGFLIKILKKLKENNGDLYIRNLNKQLLGLFEMTKLDSVFSLNVGDETFTAIARDLFLPESDDKFDFSLKLQGDIAVLLLSGTMKERVCVRTMREKIQKNLPKSKKILLDFKELESIDSLFIGGLINVNQIVHSAGGELRICNMNEEIESTLKMLSIDKIIHICKRKDLALNGWV